MDLEIKYSLVHGWLRSDLLGCFEEDDKKDCKQDCRNDADRYTCFCIDRWRFVGIVKEEIKRHYKQNDFHGKTYDMIIKKLFDILLLHL